MTHRKFIKHHDSETQRQDSILHLQRPGFLTAVDGPISTILRRLSGGQPDDSTAYSSNGHPPDRRFDSSNVQRTARYPTHRQQQQSRSLRGPVIPHLILAY